MNQQKFWNKAFRVVVWISGAILILGLAAGLFRNYKQSEIRTATKIETENGIDEHVAIKIGNINQWFYMRGQNKDNPVLLFLHGGPGAPEMPFSRMFGSKLEEHFVVVHWDQRASGKTRRESADSVLSLDIYLNDTVEAIHMLRAKFDQQKIYLIGHSWGSVLGLLTARDHPELLHAYFGMGQVVNIRENERISHEFTKEMASRENNEIALKELNNISPPYDQNPADLFIQRRWLYQYGGGFRNISFSGLLSELIYAPEYSLLDLYALYKGMVEVPIKMWPQLKDIDLAKQAEDIQIPVYFLAGRHDYNTPFELVEDYYKTLNAPYKEIIWFENSAHFMNISDPEYFQDVLISKVLSQTNNTNFEWLDEFVAKQMNEWKVPGLAISIVQDGKTMLTKGYGVKEIGTNEFVDNDTIFGMASTTKAFTSAALAMLVDDGLIRWDDSVIKYLPHLDNDRSKINKNLTVRDLLSHQTGYDRHDILWHAFGYDREEIMRRTSLLESTYPPGERFGYQNLMYLLAGRIIEAVTNQSWDQYILTNILEPLNMGRSGTSLEQLSKYRNVASPHTQNRSGETAVIPVRNADNIGAAGSVFSTASDMANWLKFQLDGTSVLGNENLKGGALAETHEKQIKIRPQDEILYDLIKPAGGDLYYGMGWFIHEYQGHEIIEHPGGIDGMSPIVTLIPELNTGVVILMNTNMPSGAQFAIRGKIIEKLLQTRPKNWSDAMGNALTRIGAKISGEIRSNSIGPEIGNIIAAPTVNDQSKVFTHEIYGDIILSINDGRMLLTFGEGGSVNPLIPTNKNQYLLVWQSPLFPPVPVFFTADDQGDLSGLDLAGVGHFVHRSK